jgi:hypothetical protein
MQQDQQLQELRGELQPLQRATHSVQASCHVLDLWFAIQVKSPSLQFGSLCDQQPQAQATTISAVHINTAGLAVFSSRQHKL